MIEEDLGRDLVFAVATGEMLSVNPNLLHDSWQTIILSYQETLGLSEAKKIGLTPEGAYLIYESSGES